MYTRKEKTRILEELWASGLPRATAAARPGWPTRETLRRWEAQADAGELDVRRPARPSHAKHLPYDPRVKAEALRLRSAGVPTRAIRARLGIASRTAISSWERAARDGRLDPRTGRPGRAGDGRGRAVGDGNGRDGRDAEVAELRLQVSVLKELIGDPKALGPGSL